MNKYKKYLKYILIIFSVLLFVLPFALLGWKLSIKSNSIVVANYQSYMSPDVQKKMSKKYDVSYDYFNTAENAKNMLVKNTGDVVNSTTYEIVNWIKSNKNIVKKIDWKKFNIEGINNSTDALNLFIPEIQEVLIYYDLNNDGKKYNDSDNTNKEEDNLLSYGIPYFLQDYIFAYRGQEIQELSKPGIKWKELMQGIVNNRDRFKSHKGIPNIFATEDARTFFSIANNIYKSDNQVSKDVDQFSNNYLESRYSELASEINKISNNPIAFNSDANVVLNKLAKKEVTGAFCYNGDALFASFGGDDEVAINATDFHIVKPIDSIAALDMFVINNKVDNDKLDKIYKMLGEITLGIYYDQNGIQVNPNNSNYDPIKSETYTNFEFVNYTTPLKSLYDYVDNNYFENNNLGMLQKSIFEVKTNGINSFEEPINDLQKSNIQFKWIGFLSSLK